MAQEFASRAEKTLWPPVYFLVIIWTLHQLPPLIWWWCWLTETLLALGSGLSLQRRAVNHWRGSLWFFLFLLHLLLTFSMWVAGSTHLPFCSGAIDSDMALGLHQKEGVSLERSMGQDILGRCFCRPIVMPLGVLRTASFLEKSQKYHFVYFLSMDQSLDIIYFYLLFYYISAYFLFLLLGPIFSVFIWCFWTTLGLETRKAKIYIIFLKWTLEISVLKPFIF